jgi:hypothetical protein
MSLPDRLKTPEVKFVRGDWYDGLDREQVKAVIEVAARSLDKKPVYAS